jgi:hypothetical protein
MHLLIESPEFEAAVRELSSVTGETEDRSVEIAVKERLDRVTQRKGREMLERIRPILNRISAMPELDPRPIDEILGYNEFGMFD